MTGAIQAKTAHRTKPAVRSMLNADIESWAYSSAMTEKDTRVRSPRWRTIAVIWLALGLLDASHTVLFMQAVGTYAWLAIFGTQLLSWLPWMLATPFIIDLTRRRPMTRGNWVSPAALHLASFLIVGLVAQSWFAALQMFFNPWRYPKSSTFTEAWSTSLPYQVTPLLIVYALMVVATYIADARERSARLNEELSKAQLAALRGQIEPHFMFNTLNSIAGLVREQRNDAAVSMIVGLSEFLRRATQDSHRAQVTLAEEVEYLQRYVDIQKVRFGERLQFSVDIPPEMLRAQVPNLLLQPLVENAIKHGVGRCVAGGSVRVAGACENGTLRLSVSNDGPNTPIDEPESHTGVGLNNLRTRLRILHGEESELQLRLAPSGEAEVVVTLPLREA
jgi:two-component system LytT family sensor kinase